MKPENLKLANELTEKIEKLDYKIMTFERSLARGGENTWRDEKDYRCVIPAKDLKHCIEEYIDNLRNEKESLQKQFDSL